MKLHDYQVKYLDGLPRDVIMTADVGLGKSIMSLAHFAKHNPYGRLVVVAPASKVRTGDWEREAKNFLGIDDLEVVSYEKFTKNWKQYVDPQLTIIADECHYVCNATSKRGKAISTVARTAAQFIGLSATPLPNGWKSAENYAVIFGVSRNKTQFHQRFVITDRSRGFPVILGYREEDFLKSWWASISRRLERTGDLKLPSRSIGKVVDMKPRQAKEYRTVRNERIYNGVLLDSAPLLFATLRQMTAPWRVNQLESILEETDEHVVVFYNYNNEREEILKLLEDKFTDRLVFEQSGHESHLPPRDAWGSMPPSVTLAQYQSASVAIELTYASVTIYFSPTYSYANFHQSMGRTRRNGQKKTTIFYMLKVEGTIDGQVWKALREKRDFDDKTIDKS